MNKAYRSTRHYDEVRARDGAECRYCGDAANEIDHVVPWIWTQDDSAENLVVSCFRCNMVARSGVFASFEHKQKWLLCKRFGVPFDVPEPAQVPRGGPRTQCQERQAVRRIAPKRMYARLAAGDDPGIVLEDYPIVIEDPPCANAQLRLE